MENGIGHRFDTVIEKNPDFNYRYFNTIDRRSFLDKHIEKVFADYYDKLIPKAYKADLFRLSAVYVREVVISTYPI